jgi:hypothetical protein
MLCCCPHLKVLTAVYATSVIDAISRVASACCAAAASTPPPAIFGAALHTLRLTRGPQSDAELDAVVAGLPQLRALALDGAFRFASSRGAITVAAWRRNLSVLLQRLEVFELRTMSYNALEALNSLAADPGSDAPDSPSCVWQLPTLPLRSLLIEGSGPVSCDVAAFVRALGQHPAQSLRELRLSAVSPETWLAAPPSVTHLRLARCSSDESHLAAIFDAARFPKLRVLVLAECDSFVPNDAVVDIGASLQRAFARSALREVSHPTLRALRVDVHDDLDRARMAARTAAREAWVTKVVGASRVGTDGSRVRFPRLRRVEVNGVTPHGWPSHDPFVPAPAAPALLQDIARHAWVQLTVSVLVFVWLYGG